MLTCICHSDGIIVKLLTNTRQILQHYYAAPCHCNCVISFTCATTAAGYEIIEGQSVDAMVLPYSLLTDRDMAPASRTGLQYTAK